MSSLLTYRYFQSFLVCGIFLTFIALTFADPRPGNAQAIDTQAIDSPALPIITAPEPITLRWFLRWDEAQLANVARPLLARFHAEHPEIQVVLENADRSNDYYHRLSLQLQRGTPPDVFYPATHVAYDLAQQGALLPLAEFLRQDALDLAAYDKAVLDLYAVDENAVDENAVDENGLYCLPIDQATLAVAYNRTLFAEAGVPYPQATWNWDDLQKTAIALTKDQDGDGVPEQYGIDRFYTYWPLLVWSATGHNVFDDPKRPTAFLLEEEDAVNAIQWLADLHLQQHAMPPVDGIDGVADPFLAGQAAMQIAGHWRVPAYLATPDLDFDVVALPRGRYQVNRNDGSCFAIADQTTHPQAAWTFVRFLAGPNGIGAQMLTELQQITPALIALQESKAFRNPLVLSDRNMQAFLPSGRTASTDPLAPEVSATAVRLFPLYDPLHPIFTAWSAVVGKELRAVWLGKRSADEAVGRMANQAEELLENLADAGAQTLLPAHPASLPMSITVGGRAGIPQVSEAPMVTRSSTRSLTGAFASSVTVSETNAFTEPLQMPAQPLLQVPRHLYVAPTGNDRYSGLQARFPVATLQHALELVQPGDTIHLAPGNYFENVTSVSAGRAAAPITIMGPPDAILHGNGDASAGFYLTHSYYTFSGFTMDGLHGDPKEKDGYTQKLLYLQGTGERVGVTGVRILNMAFRNAGGECVRFRYFAQHNEVAYSTFHVCGLLDYKFADGGKNGEAIYIGTAPDQWPDGKNPTADPDESSYNWIHHNVFDTQGNECAESKEGSYGNVFEYNLCTGQLDPDSAGFGARGNHNIIRFNTIYNNIGAGVRLGGHEIAGIQYGIENEVYGNHLIANRAGGIKIVNAPQTRVCGNQLERNLGKQIFGEGSEAYEPTTPC